MEEKKVSPNAGVKLKTPGEPVFNRFVAASLVVTILVFGLPINPPRYLPDEAKQIIQISLQDYKDKFSK